MTSLLQRHRPIGELTMTVPTTLDYYFPKYVKTGASALLPPTQVDKIVNYIRSSK